MGGSVKALALWAAVLFCAAGISCAQDAASAWVGEWGAFQAASMNGTRYSGAGLSISNCAAGRCEFAIQVMKSDGGNGGAKGFLALQSPTMAVAHLVSFGEEHCTLQLALSAAAPEIEVRPGGGDCSYYQTPGVKFEGKFPLHSRVHYVDDEIASCFAAASKVKLALCRNEQLSKQKTQWMIQYLQVQELSDVSAAEELNREGVAEAALFAGCEHAAVVDGCLRDAFSKSQRELEARMQAWHDTVTEPGDPVVAAVKAKEIAGRYRRRFANGDVTGDHFTSIDKMTITALANAVDFDLHLEFYNGHECSLKGKATYARAGSFVYLQKSDDAQEPECVFEIVPEKNGVKLKDKTGGCKMMSCGERGGYGGEGFTFKERY
ncbi:hypothetical protein GCM10011507_13690 [Edaphobacter acidisoli]|uniref:Uncharacterized protein n=1 Tax=Edaphobacter acidisoli TaxID=2040573 RepID=A0A916RPD5_9BACT|nr:hypothetical protein [Edaphobacter acidisoli]GGA63301.1 hypothetical protein GCM10011507_13690 [Edaphobacter acidisoli]